MGLMTEWQTFAALAVDYLGMPKDAMPLYDVSGKKDVVRWKKKGERILEFVLETDNFGHNRERKQSKHFFVRKTQTARYRSDVFLCHIRVFPLDSVKFYFYYFVDGIQQAYARLIDKTI